MTYIHDLTYLISLSKIIELYIFLEFLNFFYMTFKLSILSSYNEHF